jgi:putative transposase
MISDLKRERSMSKSRHTEAQIIAALKQVEAGRATDEVARENGVSKHTIYAWKAKYGGLEVNEAQRLKQLEDENGRCLFYPSGATCGFALLSQLSNPPHLSGLVQQRTLDL